MAISAIPQPLIQEAKIANSNAYSTRIQTINNPGGALQVNPTHGGWIRMVSPVSNMAISFVGVPENVATVWYVEFRNIGTFGVTWDANVVWDGASVNTGAPTTNARTGRYVVMFYSPDGSSIYGKVIYSQLNV
jgi:hypothetical protein